MRFLKSIQNMTVQLAKGIAPETPTFRPVSRLWNSFFLASQQIILIVDCSGSMSDSDYPPSRLQAAIEAACEYVRTLDQEGKNAEIGVIAFDTRAQTILPLTALNQVKPILKAIRSITVCGGTDIACGLQSALAIFQQSNTDNSERQIILLTDGHGGQPLNVANVLKTEYRVTLDVIGIGGSRSAVNECLLKGVATTDANGVNHYRFIDDTRTLKQHYQQLATGLAWKGNHR